MKLEFQRLTSTALVPQRMTPHASGFDLFADLAEPYLLAPGDVTAIPTGIALEIPLGFEGQVRPRSGLALRHNLGVLNSPGTIDADYRGEVKVIIINLGKEVLQILPQMRIAQLVFCPIVIPELVETPTLGSSERQDGGFGHTGN
ncbi:dUTP diphosphatase [Candidatus Cloacimonadota bacterium]|jgi:dUTP pyrophosphatase|nr:dUTP diphosphatase [Candidatus Cloacimonadota bacterium]MDD3236154.1 dUTP diphosphatase [Candidatus Cloacimonadota bacterium]